jgi:hypothetical protein
LLIDAAYLVEASFIRRPFNSVSCVAVFARAFLGHRPNPAFGLQTDRHPKGLCPGSRIGYGRQNFIGCDLVPRIDSLT